MVPEASDLRLFVAIVARIVHNMCGSDGAHTHKITNMTIRGGSISVARTSLPDDDKNRRFKFDCPHQMSRRRRKPLLQFQKTCEN